MKGNRIPHPWKTLGRNPIAGAWSPEDHARLLSLAGTMHPAEIAKVLGRTESAIRNRSKSHGFSLATTHPRQLWTHDEERYLKQNHQRLTILQMAKSLGRSYSSTAQKCERLGLDCRIFGEKNHQTIYCAEDVELSRALFEEGLTRKEIAEKMEIPYQSICNFISFAYRKRG